jgi:GNAT superfamily N-acetyltransferase
MSAPAFARASDDEISAFAEMRCRDAAVRRLYTALAQESEACVVRIGDDAVGIAFASESGNETFVHEVFVRSSHRRSGLGSRLLSEVSGDAEARFVIVDAAESAALSFAIRHAPIRGVLLTCSGGIPHEDDLLRLAASEGRRLEVTPLDIGAQRFPIEALESEVRGAPLGGDHATLGLLASGNAFFLNDELVGYAYTWPDGRIGPLVASSPSYLEQIFAYAIAALVQRHRASWVQCLVPGENARLLRAAVRCGLTPETEWLIARSSAAGDPSRYVACHPLIY